MELSRFDLIDRFNAWTFSRTTTHKKGHEITYNAIAMDDVNQALDEIMGECDTIHIVTKRDYIINDYVWYKERIYKVIDLNNKEVVIFDIEVKGTEKVKRKKLRLIH